MKDRKHTVEQIISKLRGAQVALALPEPDSGALNIAIIKTVWEEVTARVAAIRPR